MRESVPFCAVSIKAATLHLYKTCIDYAELTLLCLVILSNVAFLYCLCKARQKKKSYKEILLIHQCLVNAFADLIVVFMLIQNMLETKKLGTTTASAVELFEKKYNECLSKFVSRFKKYFTASYLTSANLTSFKFDFTKFALNCASETVTNYSHAYLSSALTFSLMSSLTSNVVLSFIKFVFVSKPLTAAYLITSKGCYVAIAVITVSATFLG